MLSKKEMSDVKYSLRLTDVVKKGNVKLAEYLLSNGCLIDEMDKRTEQTALHIAVSLKNKSMVEILLSHNPDVRVSDINGNTPLHIAAKMGNLKIVELLLNVPMNNDRKIRYANSLNNICITPIYLAALARHVKIVKLLYDHGARISLDTFVRKENISLLESILSQGVPADEIDIQRSHRRRTALHIAVSRGNLNVVKLLLNHGAKVMKCDIDLEIPLHYAAEYGNLEIVKILLDVKMNDKIFYVNSKSFDHMTPLHYAVSKGYTEIVKLLIKNGADPSIQRKEDHLTPLHLAIMGERIGIIREILNADLNPKNYINLLSINGYSAFHIACFSKSETMPEMIDLLLDAQADINITNNKGLIPLHVAAVSENVYAVKKLLMLGGNIHKENYLRMTPLYYAILGDSFVPFRLIRKMTVPILAKYISEDRLMKSYGKSKGYFNETVIRLLVSKGAKVLPVLELLLHSNNFVKPEIVYELFHSNIDVSNIINSVNLDSHNLFTVKIILKIGVKMGQTFQFHQTKKQKLKDKLYEYQDACKVELEFLKSRKICSTYTLFDVLYIPICKLIGLTINEQLIQYLSSETFKEDYKIYGDWLIYRFNYAHLKKTLYKKCEKIINHLICQKMYLRPVCLNILQHLSEIDLANLANTIENSAAF